MQKEQLLQSVERAIRSEEKQGHVNTGAIGGFSTYLLEVSAEYADVIPPILLEQLQRIGTSYGQVSPFKRRGLLLELKELIQLIPPFPVESDLNNESVPKPPISHLPVADLPKKNSIQYLKGIGPQRLKQFEQLGIETSEDLLRYYPKRYEIRMRRKIAELKDGELVVLSGKVTGSQLTRGKVKVVKLNIEQDGRSVHGIWFNQEYILKQYPRGSEITIVGKVQWNKRIPEILVTEISRGNSLGPIEEHIPVYSETARLPSRLIRSAVESVLLLAEKLLPEILPEDEQGLVIRSEAYRQIHFPKSATDLEKARKRLVIEEILLLQLALTQLRTPDTRANRPVLQNGGALVRNFLSKIPFQLTSAQKRVIQEIFRDLQNPKGMSRLLQGDVGSGKTVVAMMAILQAVGSGFQAAMMAPTEVLAQQHFETLRAFFEPLSVHVELLIGSQTKAERQQILHQIHKGEARVVVGTHALIQDKVQFNALGLVVTDEQHRFGVRQRTLLQDKGDKPHVLVMTATPIPRTLALTLYGDLQLSVMKELPLGRKPIFTKRVSERNRPNMEKFMEQQISQGRQIYVVCPLVEETEKSDLVSATERAQSLAERFPSYPVALLHGRMKGQEKEQIMQQFKNGGVKILVATTVVEVGINVPNATVIVVEGAERFGLAQLHQLRGRVGRGEYQSYCFLMSDGKNHARLEVLCKTEDGFLIAEEDLKLRGPGELLGLRQHGVPELKLTDLTRDALLVEQAYQILQRALQDPGKYARLHQEADRLYPREKIGVN